MSSSSKSKAMRQRGSWILPTNPVPPAARPRKATSPEMNQRITYATQMFFDGRRDHEIKAFFRKQYGLQFSQVSRYIRLARVKLAETNKLNLEQLRAEQWARYMEIYRAPDNDGTKLSALRAAGSLYGVDAPQKVAETTVDGQDINVLRQTVEGLTVEELRTLRSARNRMQSIASGESAGSN
ncbi:MAG: hypothetical protein ACYC0X_00080 [Pirellulaceae bacterium]